MNKIKKLSKIILIAIFLSSCKTSINKEYPLKNMQKNKWGRIINIASISVKEPLSYLALSNTLRSSVIAWAKTLASDVAKDHITVNNILTGYFDTERIQQLNSEKSKKLNISEDKVLEAMKAQVPMKEGFQYQ